MQLSSSQSTGVLSVPFQLPTQSTALRGLLWENELYLSQTQERLLSINTNEFELILLFTFNYLLTSLMLNAPLFFQGFFKFLLYSGWVLSMIFLFSL